MNIHKCITIERARQAKNSGNIKKLAALSKQVSGSGCVNCKRIWLKFLAEGGENK